MATSEEDRTRPYVIVSSDTHAGLQCEEYRPYLDSKYHAQFDEYVKERHKMRRLAEEVNGEYIEQWESDNAEGLRGAYDPEVRDKELDHHLGGGLQNRLVHILPHLEGVGARDPLGHRLDCSGRNIA